MIIRLFLVKPKFNHQSRNRKTPKRWTRCVLYSHDGAAHPISLVSPNAITLKKLVLSKIVSDIPLARYQYCLLKSYCSTTALYHFTQKIYDISNHIEPFVWSVESFRYRRPPSPTARHESTISKSYKRCMDNYL